MAETSRAQYRDRTPRATKDKQNKDPTYTRIITLQLFLCVLILLAVIAVKQFGGQAYEVFKESYQQIVSESYTGRLFNENLEAIEDAVEQTFSFLGQNTDEKAGMGGEMPAFSFSLASRRMRAPKGATLSPLIVFGSVLYPVEGGTLTSDFGYRKHPVTGKQDFHTGIDIAAPRGTRIMAALSGRVIKISEDAIYGNVIVLDHGAAFYTVYCHCERIVAPLDAKVKSGETIALVGDTGVATGPHLHFEMQKDGLCADPMWVFDKEGQNVL
ncbi:MAG: M23 family metallopeptidase [Acetanaerobacterium sp.]